jgi:outer membrane protein assembly factor BamA
MPSARTTQRSSVIARIKAFSLVSVFFSCLQSPLFTLADPQDPKDIVYTKDGIENLEKFEGKTIRNITINVTDVFEEPTDNRLFATANSIKINTNDSVVRRELLFKEGDTFSAFRIKESERVLRQLRFNRDPIITPKMVGDYVDIDVKTQDTWTLIPTFNYSSGDGSGSKSVGISESNILGLGKRAELLVSDEENRRTFEGIYDDWRVMNSKVRMVLANFYRADGNRFVGLIESPYRTLLDKHSWSFDADIADNIGKLWSGGNERFIYRRNSVDLGANYSWSLGPREHQERITLGLDYEDSEFKLPTAQDYIDANVDQSDIVEDPTLLAKNRKFVGPRFSYESLEPRFIQMRYIDRFDRPDDYDIGRNFSFSGTTAFSELGSIEDALLFNLNQTAGMKFSSSSFLRGELGFSGRNTYGDFENTLFRAESKYYNVLGDVRVKDIFLGKHTLAFGYSLDFANKLDQDREFLLGADSGLRGYDSRTFTGDKRFILNIEDRVHIAEDVWKLMSFGAAAFVDVGGSTYDSFSSLFKEDLYGDAGIGLRFAFPRSSGGRTLRIDFAVPFRDGQDGSNAYEVRLIFAGGQTFSARTRSEQIGTQKANVEVGTDR